MLKRTLILLSLTGGLLLFAGHNQLASAFHNQYQLNLNLPQEKANQILKVAGPQLSLSFKDACAAYQKGSLTIDEAVNLTDTYQVEFGGLCIMILIEDL